MIQEAIEDENQDNSGDLYRDIGETFHNLRKALEDGVDTTDEISVATQALTDIKGSFNFYFEWEALKF